MNKRVMTPEEYEQFLKELPEKERKDWQDFDEYLKGLSEEEVKVLLGEEEYNRQQGELKCGKA